MKKVLSLLLAVMMLLGTCAIAFAADARAIVYVAIADNKGKLVVPNKTVMVSDIDEDGALTINDALYCAHEQYYEGGAAKGYNSYTGQYDGLSLGKLWGEENNGSFGYYVNNAQAWSLADPVKEGDFVYAWLYQDAKGWSDVFSCFAENNVKAKSYETIEVTYTYVSSYDDNYNPIFSACEGAEITVDDVATGVFTDKDGKASVIIPVSGEHIISAKAPVAKEGETQLILTPPICKVTVQFDIFGLINSILDSIKAYISEMIAKVLEIINPAPVL